MKQPIEFAGKLSLFADILDIQKGEKIVGFEVQGIVTNRGDDGSTECMPIEGTQKAEMYSVYARVGTADFNLAQIIADCDYKKTAYALAKAFEKIVIATGGTLLWKVKK